MRRRSFVGSVTAIAIGVSTLAGCGAPAQDDEGTETPAGGEGTETAARTETATEPAETEGATNTATPGAEAGGDGTETVIETGAGTAATPGIPAATYRLGGRVEAWIGQDPGSIADRENPTLELEAGERYSVTWENLDGQPHDFAIQDADGNTLESTEQTSEQGATLSLTFTASDAMSQYICTVHPTTMVGDVRISG